MSLGLHDILPVDQMDTGAIWTAVAAAQAGPEMKPDKDDAPVAAATQVGPDTELEHDQDGKAAIAKVREA